MHMRYPNDKMLLRIAQGDAYALAVEYCKREEHEDLFKAIETFESYQQHPNPKHGNLRAGMYSDDTQMSIAVAETLITYGAQSSENDFAEAFYNTFKRDPRDGYSRGFQDILNRATSTANMLKLIVPNSNKNGACMRAVPLGVIPDVEALMNTAAVQAIVTHNTFGGIFSAIHVALMSHYALYDERDFSHMHAWCVEQCEEYVRFAIPWSGPVGHKQSDILNIGIGMCTSHAVQTLLQQCTSLKDIMMKVIEWGGDTDSVASIAWGIASTRYQDEVLPEFLSDELEARGNIKYGPDFLLTLGSNLMKAFNK